MEPTIYKPSIYKGAGIYNLGGGGGGNGIACIRCVKGGKNYFEIPINCATNSTFEIGFNLIGDWSNNSCGIFAGYGSTYYPPIALRAIDNNTSNFGIGLSNAATTYINSLKLYPNSFNFYHVKIYPKNGYNTISAIDSQGNQKESSIGVLLDEHTINLIRLFIYSYNLNNAVSGFEIYYFRIIDSNDVILDLIPDEQNGVPGFTDKVSGNFYLPNDSTAFEAVKPRAPL